MGCLYQFLIGTNRSGGLDSLEVSKVVRRAARRPMVVGFCSLAIREVVPVDLLSVGTPPPCRTDTVKLVEQTASWLVGVGFSRSSRGPEQRREVAAVPL